MPARSQNPILALFGLLHPSAHLDKIEYERRWYQLEDLATTNGESYGDKHLGITLLSILFAIHEVCFCLSFYTLAYQLRFQKRSVLAMRVLGFCKSLAAWASWDSDEAQKQEESLVEYYRTRNIARMKSNANGNSLNSLNLAHTLPPLTPSPPTPSVSSTGSTHPSPTTVGLPGPNGGINNTIQAPPGTFSSSSGGGGGSGKGGHGVGGCGYYHSTPYTKEQEYDIDLQGLSLQTLFALMVEKFLRGFLQATNIYLLMAILFVSYEVWRKLHTYDREKDNWGEKLMLSMGQYQSRLYQRCEARCRSILCKKRRSGQIHQGSPMPLGVPPGGVPGAGVPPGGVPGVPPGGVPGAPAKNSSNFPTLMQYGALYTLPLAVPFGLYLLALRPMWPWTLLHEIYTGNREAKIIVTYFIRGYLLGVANFSLLPQMHMLQKQKRMAPLVGDFFVCVAVDKIFLFLTWLGKIIMVDLVLVYRDVADFITYLNISLALLAVIGCGINCALSVKFVRYYQVACLNAKKEEPILITEHWI